MRRIILLTIMVLLAVSCRNEKPAQQIVSSSENDKTKAGLVIVARDIVTETIIKPDPEGDPWEVEKVAGFQGKEMIDGVFNSIYNGTLVAKDYHTGEILCPSDIKAFEKEFKNDRSRIGKLSFTEDWFYDPADNDIIKKVKSVAFGYELINNDGKVFGYKAVFEARIAK